MIVKLPHIINLTIAEIRYLLSIRPWQNKWGMDDVRLSAIKTKIKNQLIVAQNRCAYCGMPFKGPKDKQVEHIAPKASFRQPQFTFTLQNLVLSCIHCNNLIVKGSRPTVQLPAHRLYSKCKFIIVHPYLDNPDLHFDWVDNQDKILIQVKDNSPKGKASIEMFELDSEGMSEMRAALVALQRFKVSTPLSVADEIKVTDTLDYNEKI